jgi:hypothetical protein
MSAKKIQTSGSIHNYPRKNASPCPISKLCTEGKRNILFLGVKIRTAPVKSECYLWRYFPTAQLNMAVSNLKFRQIHDNEKEKLDTLIWLRDSSVDCRI